MISITRHIFYSDPIRTPFIKLQKVPEQRKVEYRLRLFLECFHRVFYLVRYLVLG